MIRRNTANSPTRLHSASPSPPDPCVSLNKHRTPHLRSPTTPSRNDGIVPRVVEDVSISDDGVIRSTLKPCRAFLPLPYNIRAGGGSGNVEVIHLAHSPAPHTLRIPHPYPQAHLRLLTGHSRSGKGIYNTFPIRITRSRTTLCKALHAIRRDRRVVRDSILGARSE